MGKLHKWLPALAVASLLLAAWLGRYQVVATPTAATFPSGYRLDRWTGRVDALIGGQYVPVELKDGGQEWWRGRPESMAAAGRPATRNTENGGET